MRYFDSSAMNAPWRARWCTRTIQDGETDYCEVNPNEYGVNQDLDASVDLLKATGWWFEPNLETGDDPAIISFAVMEEDGTPIYSALGTEPQMKRVKLGNVVSGESWRIRLVGTDVPASTDASYYYGQQKRAVHVAMYYENE